MPILKPNQINELYNKLKEVPSLAYELSQYQKDEVRNHVENQIWMSLDFVNKTIMLNPNYNYPADYIGREVDYWLDRNVNYKDAIKVKSAIEQSNTNQTLSHITISRISDKTYRDFDNYLDECIQSYHTLIVTYSRSNDIIPLAKKFLEYQQDIRYKNFNDQFYDVFINQTKVETEIISSNLESLYYDLGYKRSRFIKITEQLEVIKDENPNNKYAYELYYSTYNWFVEGISRWMATLRRVNAKYGEVKLKTPLTLDDYTLDGKLIEKEIKDNAPKHIALPKEEPVRAFLKEVEYLDIKQSKEGWSLEHYRDSNRQYELFLSSLYRSALNDTNILPLEGKKGVLANLVRINQKIEEFFDWYKNKIKPASNFDLSRFVYELPNYFSLPTDLPISSKDNVLLEKNFIYDIVDGVGIKHGLVKKFIEELGMVEEYSNKQEVPEKIVKDTPKSPTTEQKKALDLLLKYLEEGHKLEGAKLLAAKKAKYSIRRMHDFYKYVENGDWVHEGLTEFIVNKRSGLID